MGRREKKRAWLGGGGVEMRLRARSAAMTSRGEAGAMVKERRNRRWAGHWRCLDDGLHSTRREAESQLKQRTLNQEAVPRVDGDSGPMALAMGEQQVFRDGWSCRVQQAGAGTGESARYLRVSLFVLFVLRLSVVSQSQSQLLSQPLVASPASSTWPPAAVAPASWEQSWLTSLERRHQRGPLGASAAVTAGRLPPSISRNEPPRNEPPQNEPSRIPPRWSCLRCNESVLDKMLLTGRDGHGDPRLPPG
ncbi:uncharacterized protein BDZ99DRAFT_526215 [Mytilinidion resinicola]|uniref:Uncharacterized protein n=1 Tax=Mytilinidion resinicola TaxID=574789 RepID=A0A6A6Y5D7_9PEZI|nr:uncharacterized protein BDZ99DRAFT_526215 [Mytilinidion resinicola]KAF2803738.1 hypothetical protein BDZ99DRAFT_526215 [Mytilinidion resinicola]